jgi:two-component system, NtrC family, sensor kinase
VRPGALAEAVTQLAWLPPTGSSLLALARPFTAASWPALREDPGAVLLLLRTPSISRVPADLFSLPELARSPEILALTARYLRAEGEGCLPDWSLPGRVEVRAACLRYARVAHALALQGGLCDPDKAWVAGLLAPLGWLALALCSPHKVADGLSHPGFARDPGGVQRSLWGLDHAEVARRLARRWMLPSWLGALVGHLALPLDVAHPLGAEPVLFPLTQMAVALVEQQGHGLGLSVGASVTELVRTLDLPVPLPAEGSDSSVVSESVPADDRPTLVDLLELAAENRRLHESRGGSRLEADLDVLHRALAEQRSREEEKLRAQKLSALAEFAAGAGHEINNPLAVISGQAQYLMGHEADPDRRKCLEIIVGQAQRIHQLLRDVMQFARPPAPVLQPVDLIRLVDEVAVSLESYAQSRQVRLRVRESDDDATGDGAEVPVPAGVARSDAPLLVEADPGQLRTALACLLRNAIEAAPAEGWASVRLAMLRPGQVEVLVEDSGDDLPPAHREHLFDPFYSGRPAGRGRGLGLPMAWSLARQQGGDVFLASQSGEPTRFVLRLPISSSGPVALAG